MFMGDKMKPQERRSVDFALSFLAKDSSEFDRANT